MVFLFLIITIICSMVMTVLGYNRNQAGLEVAGCILIGAFIALSTLEILSRCRSRGEDERDDGWR